MSNPIRPTDDAARALARDLIAGATFAALAVRDPDTGAPHVTRIALAPGPEGLPVAPVSDLSHHTAALRADPVCALLVGEPGPKGDPLTHPRLTIQATARLVGHGDAERAALDKAVLAHLPKTGLYLGFADFRIAVFTPTGAHLNGGFGKAFVLRPEDLVLPGPAR